MPPRRRSTRCRVDSEEGRQDIYISQMLSTFSPPILRLDPGQFVLHTRQASRVFDGCDKTRTSKPISAIILTDFANSQFHKYTIFLSLLMLPETCKYNTQLLTMLVEETHINFPVIQLNLCTKISSD